MITVVTGTPGSGKSCYGVIAMADKLATGGNVATNVALTDRFHRSVARRNPLSMASPGRYRRALASVTARCVELQEPADMRLVWPVDRREGSTLVVIDEAYGLLDGRDFRASDRKDWIDWLTQHRKLGLDVMFIVQHYEMLDSNVRRLAEYEVRLRDLRRARAYGLVPTPVPASVAHWFWSSMSSKPTRTQIFRPGRAHGLFDTKATLNGVSADPPAGAILLPRPPASGSTESRREAGPAGEPPVVGPGIPAASADPTPSESAVNGSLADANALEGVPSSVTTEGAPVAPGTPSRDGALPAPLDAGP